MTPATDTKLPADPSPFTDRHAFHRDLRVAMAGARSGVPHALFVVHIERFADAVSRCGPDAAVALQQLVHHNLTQQLGPDRCICRLRPDRFCLLEDRCPPRDAAILARRILGAFGGGVFRWKRLAFRLGARVSVVELGAPDLAGAEEALRRADQACHASVLLGNEGILALYGRPDEHVALSREIEWRDHLREVL
jgi:GGDEF domain-containing protein